MSRLFAQVQQRLDELGTHTLNDILVEIENGHMLSFSAGETWAVIQPMIFPRKRVAQIFLVVGHGQDLENVWRQVLEWARENNISEFWGWGRRGWSKYRKLEATFGRWEEANRVLYRRAV